MYIKFEKIYSIFFSTTEEVFIDSSTEKHECRVNMKK